MFDPKEFISLARGFSEPGRSEADYRTAISRSLYGIFLWAREELDQRGQHVKTGESNEHSKVRQCFKEGPYRHSSTSQRLGGLYDLRYKSDYTLDVVVRYEDLVQALEYVDYLENVFKTYHFAKPPA